MGDIKATAVGAFVLGGFVLFGIGLFMIGDRRRLFDDSFEIYAEFAQLGGVQDGASVRVAGMDAGEVVDISFPRSPSENFRVRLRVIEELHPLIRTDSVASIRTDGLVGNKLVQIEAGSESAPKVTPGAMIQSREPFELQELMQNASDTVSLVDETIERLRGDVETTLDTFGETMQDAGTIVTDVGKNVEQVSATTAEITTEVKALVSDVRQGKGSLGRLLNDDDLYEKTVLIADQIHGISEDAARATENIKDLSEDVKGTFGKLNDGDGPSPDLMKEARVILTSAREAMGDMAENMESLKRSFFFRGMFLDRGFYDLDSLSPQEYLHGSLRDKHHRTLRMWVSAAALFETSPSGEVVLSEEGRSKLNAALRRILRYPSNCPLIVEGYADVGSLDEQFRTARKRAVAVRDYIVEEFHRDANYTGYVALESMEPENVDADGGDGVVLALYYDNEAPAPPRNRVN